MMFLMTQQQDTGSTGARVGFGISPGCLDSFVSLEALIKLLIGQSLCIFKIQGVLRSVCVYTSVDL